VYIRKVGVELLNAWVALEAIEPNGAKEATTAKPKALVP
jgi:hypothetical protein